MKLFFKYILVIFLISVSTGLTIEFLSDNGLRNLKNCNYNDWENIIEGKINANIIINGSSRGYVGYNPVIFEKQLNLSCFNISYNAGGYNLQQSKFDIYLKNNKKPEIIIQNIDLAYFIKNDELAEEQQFVPFLYDNDIETFIKQYDQKYSYLKYIPLLKYNQDLKLLKKGLIANFSSSVDNNMKTYQGYCPQNRDFHIDYNNLKKKNDNNIIENKRRTKLLNEMVDLYFFKLNKNAKVILIWAPEYRLRLNTDFELKRKAILEEILVIQKKYKNFLFIDMAHDEIANDSKYYYDTFHLNELGSNVFSNKAAMKIKNFLN